MKCRSTGNGEENGERRVENWGFRLFILKIFFLNITILIIFKLKN